MASGEDFVFHLLEIHFTVTGFLHSNFVILVNRFLSPFLVLWPLLCFLLPKHSSIHFLNLENICLGFGGNLLLLNSFLLCFHHFLDLTINGHISLLGMLGVPLSTVNL